MIRGGVTTEADILAVLRGRMDYPTLLQRLREANKPVCGVMMPLERLYCQRRVELTDRYSRPWVSSYFGSADDYGPMFVELVPGHADRCEAMRVLRRMIEERKIVLPWLRRFL